MNHQATRSLVALLLLMAALASAAAPPAVGVLADAERLRFRGNETFSTEAIVEALGADVAVLQAAHPFAPLESYTDVLRAKLMLGYLRNGFPLAKVAVAVDDAAKAVNITIAEGPRMANGAIQVVGAQAVSEADLCKRLTTPRPTTGGEADPPAWKEGEPARFDRVSMKRMATQVRLAYAHFGRFFPDVAVKVVPQRDGRTAKLVIVVRHEGPKAVVGSIEVTGAKINRPQDVVERLGLRVGMPLDGAAVAAMERKLWHSGRFLASEIAPEEPDELSGAVCLRIRLREYDKAPPLKQALSATDQAMLRMRDRLEGFAKGSADAVFTTLQGTAETELVLSWHHGVLARTRDTKAGTDEILLFGPGRLGRYELSGAERGGVESAHRAAIAVKVAVGADADENAEKPFKFHLGASATTAEAGKPAFEADVTLEPVAFLGLARREGLTSSVADGVVTLQGEAFLLRVREATGEIEELTVPRVLAGGTLRIAFVPGRFEQHRKALDALPRDAVRSVSVVELLALFLTRSAPRAVLFARGTAEEHGRAAKAIIHLVRGAAAPLAEAGAARRKEGDLFILPISAGAGGIPELLAQVAIPAARRIFPKRSWPVTLVREAALVACGRGQYTTIVLGQLYQSEDTGPIGCLTTAWLLGYVNGDMARVFARRGLERLSIGAFRKDAGIVLATDGMVSKMLSGFRQAALELSDEDVEALDVVLMPDYGRVVVSFLQSIRGGRPEAEPRAALAAALDAWWKETLRPRVARALQGIVGGTENAP